MNSSALKVFTGTLIYKVQPVTPILNAWEFRSSFYVHMRVFNIFLININLLLTIYFQTTRENLISRDPLDHLSL